MTDFEERVDAEMAKYTGPWETRQVGPLQVRSRKRPRREFVALDLTLADLKAALLEPLIPIVDWLTARLR